MIRSAVETGWRVVKETALVSLAMFAIVTLMATSPVLADEPQGAEFFGVKATGRRFLFIVDASMSMRGEKFAGAKRELKAAVERLTPDQAFNVAFFNTGAFWMFRDENKSPELVAATPENVRTLSHLLDTVQLGYNTEPADALIAAVKIAPDAVYLLSDGKFTDKGFTHRWLKGNNILDPKAKEKRPKVVIHTLAFHNHDGAESLRTIAASSGGTYRFVPSQAEISKKNKVTGFPK